MTGREVADEIEDSAAKRNCPRHNASARSCQYAGGKVCQCRRSIEMMHKVLSDYREAFADPRMADSYTGGK